MAKNSTLSFNVPFNHRDQKNLKEKTLLFPQISPSDSVITNILAFSKALKIEKSKAGLIEIVLN